MADLALVTWLAAYTGGQSSQYVLFYALVALSLAAWVVFALVLSTGTLNLWVRGVRPANFTDADWLASPFGSTVLAKLALFATVIALSLVHDFVLGPRATAAIAADPRSAEAARLRRQASWMGRANVILALLLVAAGVMLVRGVPF